MATNPEADPAAPQPRATAMPLYSPTPSQAENDAFRNAIATNGGPPRNYIFAADGSPVDPQSFSPVQPTPPTWP